jgi:hypothetical protein
MTAPTPANQENNLSICVKVTVTNPVSFRVRGLPQGLKTPAYRQAGTTSSNDETGPVPFMRDLIFSDKLLVRPRMPSSYFENFHDMVQGGPRYPYR